jgi:hypothetical protein
MEPTSTKSTKCGSLCPLALSCSQDGWTALHFAALSSSPSCASVLVQRGAKQGPEHKVSRHPLFSHLSLSKAHTPSTSPSRSATRRSSTTSSSLQPTSAPQTSFSRPPRPPNPSERHNSPHVRRRARRRRPPRGPPLRRGCRGLQKSGPPPPVRLTALSMAARLFTRRRRTPLWPSSSILAPKWRLGMRCVEYGGGG